MSSALQPRARAGNFPNWWGRARARARFFWMSASAPFFDERANALYNSPYFKTKIFWRIFLGWNFAKITDVMVHRVHDGQALQDAKNTAELVFTNGCRNSAYRALAPFNPWRDSTNGLINNFDFRFFMFQEMLSGDSIMITAKVIACVEEIDCAPVSLTKLKVSMNLNSCYGCNIYLFNWTRSVPRRCFIRFKNPM